MASNSGNNNEDALDTVRRVIQELRGAPRCNDDDGVVDTCESEVTVNALVGPERTYTGPRMKDKKGEFINEFRIDSGRVPLSKYKGKERELVERIRTERAQREEKEAQEEMRETSSTLRSIKSAIAAVDPLGLGAISEKLKDPNSQITQLFLEARFKNLSDFLNQFEKRRAAILEARRSRPLRAPNPATKSGSDDDVLKHEIQFEDSILARIEFLTQEITTEFRSVGYEGHVLPPETKPRRSRLGVLESDDEGDESSDDPKSKRKRGDGSGTTRVLRDATMILNAKIAIVTRMINAINELNSLVGLVSVKRNMARLIISSIVQVGIAGLFDVHKNIMLFGQPGTGKTTVAARASDVFRAMGIIPERPVFNSSMQTNDRSTLVSGFEGQTAIKVRQQFARFYGGVLFIDEIYTLHQGERDESGNEAVDSLVKFTEDFKGEVLVIGAGYEDLIRKRILDSNEGFSSRFPYKWRLPNYSAQQLVHLTLPPTPEMARFESYVPFDSVGGQARLVLLPIGVKPNPAGGSITGKPRDILVELIGRAWEKNMFEDTNARGSINLRRTIDEVRAQRLFVEASRTALIDRSKPVVEEDIYRAFVLWCDTEKDVRVYFTHPETRLFVK